MKLTNIFEDVVDLAKRRQQKQADDEHLPSIEDVLSNIEDTIELTIDYLKQRRGMDEDEARGVVMKHLSDLVMSHDLMN